MRMTKSELDNEDMDELLKDIEEELEQDLEDENDSSENPIKQESFIKNIEETLDKEVGKEKPITKKSFIEEIRSTLGEEIPTVDETIENSTLKQGSTQISDQDNEIGSVEPIKANLRSSEPEKKDLERLYIKVSDQSERIAVYKKSQNKGEHYNVAQRRLVEKKKYEFVSYQPMNGNKVLEYVKTYSQKTQKRIKTRLSDYMMAEKIKARKYPEQTKKALKRFDVGVYEAIKNVSRERAHLFAKIMLTPIERNDKESKRQYEQRCAKMRKEKLYKEGFVVEYDVSLLGMINHPIDKLRVLSNALHASKDSNSRVRGIPFLENFHKHKLLAAASEKENKVERRKLSNTRKTYNQILPNMQQKIYTTKEKLHEKFLKLSGKLSNWNERATVKRQKITSKMKETATVAAKEIERKLQIRGYQAQKYFGIFKLISHNKLLEMDHKVDKKVRKYSSKAKEGVILGAKATAKGMKTAGIKLKIKGYQSQNYFGVLKLMSHNKLLELDHKIDEKVRKYASNTKNNAISLGKFMKESFKNTYQTSKDRRYITGYNLKQFYYTSKEKLGEHREREYENREKRLENLSEFMDQQKQKLGSRGKEFIEYWKEDLKNTNQRRADKAYITGYNLKKFYYTSKEKLGEHREREYENREKRLENLAGLMNQSGDKLKQRYAIEKEKWPERKANTVRWFNQSKNSIKDLKNRISHSKMVRKIAISGAIGAVLLSTYSTLAIGEANHKEVQPKNNAKVEHQVKQQEKETVVVDKGTTYNISGNVVKVATKVKNNIERQQKESEKVVFKDALIDALEIDGEDTFTIDSGTFYEVSDGTGKTGNFEISKLAAVDANGKITSYEVGDKTISEIKEQINQEHPGATISYCATDSKSNSDIGWSVGGENNIEQRIFNQTIASLKSKLSVKDLETLCNTSMTDKVDKEKIKGLIKDVKEARESIKQQQAQNEQGESR